MNKITGPALRYHGSKWRLYPWLAQFFPAQHRIYVEPFGGSAAVLLQKSPVQSEVYNDANGDIVNLFRVLRDPEQSKRLIEQLRLTPYARAEFEHAYESVDDPIERARRLIIRATMGHGSGGATKGTTGFRFDSTRDYGSAASYWAKYPDNLARVALRFSNVMVEHKSALEVCEQHAHPDALIYLDPPYLHSTRVMRGRTYGEYELSVDEHKQILSLITELDAYVIISGYVDEIGLYDRMLSGWQRFQTRSRIAAGRGTQTRVESIWCNPAVMDSYAQGVLSFSDAEGVAL